MSDNTRIAKRKTEYRSAEKKYKRDQELQSQFRKLNQTIPARKKKEPLTDKELTDLDGVYRETIDLISKRMKSMEEIFDKAEATKKKLDLIKPYIKNPELINNIKDENEKTAIQNEIQKKATYETDLDTYKTYRKNNQANYDYMMKLRKTLSKDLKTIDLCRKHKDHPSITQLYENSRSEQLVYDLTNTKKLGGAQNTRYFVQASDKKGFFSISKRGTTFNKQIADIKEKNIKKYGENSVFNVCGDKIRDVINELMNDKAFFMSGLSKAGKYTMAAYSEDGREDVLKSFRDILREKHSKKLLTTADMRMLSSSMNSIDSPEIFMSFIDLIEDTAKTINTCSVKKSVGIRTEAKVDKRNSAMSMVAGLIGCDKLIAKSVNMQIKDPSTGKIVSGTFMENAEGFDISNTDPSVMKKFNELSPNKLESILSLKKDIANLQVLDWICGNPDRHVANMFYKFDENGNLVGIQGIDNDSCFGKNNHSAIMNGIFLENMSVIPKETADKILKLDKESLKTMLYGYDLSTAEVNNALNRVNELQDKIIRDAEYFRDKPFGYVEDGRIRIMSDDELGKTSFFMDMMMGDIKDKEKIPQGCKAKNLFGLIGLEALDARVLGENISLIKRDAFDEAGQVAKDNFDMGRAIEAMEESQRKTHFVHDQFGHMIEALRDCKTTYEGFDDVLLEHKLPDDDHPEEIFRANTEKINEYLQKLQTAFDRCNDYLDTKVEADINKKSKNSNAYKRFHMAKNMKNRIQKTMDALHGITEKADRVAEYKTHLTEMDHISNKEFVKIGKAFRAQHVKNEKEVAKINAEKENPAQQAQQMQQGPQVQHVQ